MPDSASATDSIFRLFTSKRYLYDTIGTTVVDNIGTVGKVMAGIVKDNAGATVAGATVKLVRQSDDRIVREQISAANGSYSFDRDVFDTDLYYVIAYKGSSPQIHGVTDRNLTAV